MISNSLYLSDAIENFFYEKAGEFSLGEICSYLRENHKNASSMDEDKLRDEIESILEEDELLDLMTRFDENLRDWIYVSKPALFKSADFCVKPSSFELKNGILLPGHRFMPFCSPDVFPSAVTVSVNGQKLRRGKVKISFQDSIIYHSLFGIRGMLEYFSADEEANSGVIENYESNPNLILNAFNFRRCYKDWNMKEGDCMIFHVESWLEGIFTVKPFPFEKRGTLIAEIRDWSEKFSAALESTFEDLGPTVPIEEQLSQAFFEGGEYLLRNPLMNIGGFLEQSNAIQIKNMMGRSILWRKDEDPVSEVDLSNLIDEMDTVLDIDPDSMDRVLQVLNIPHASWEIEAYIRDELFHNRKVFEKLIERCLGDFKIDARNSSEDKAQLIDMIKTMWDEVSQSYNRFSDDNAGKLRAELLKMKDEYNSWLSKMEMMGVEIDDFPIDETLNLSEIMAHISGLLESLNFDDEIDERELKRHLRLLSNTSEQMSQLMREIEEISLYE